jgi:hypothetical protein
MHATSTHRCLYDPKVRAFDAWGLWSYEGAGRIEFAPQQQSGSATYPPRYARRD